MSKLSLDQKKLLVSEYQRSGIMSQAMRISGIGSRKTAYQLWKQYLQYGEKGLVSQKTNQRSIEQTSPDVAKQIQEVWVNNPSWGRRKIAHSINYSFERTVISPSGVGKVVHREKERLVGASLSDLPNIDNGIHENNIDIDMMIKCIDNGLRASVEDNPKVSSYILNDLIWIPLTRSMPTWYKLAYHPYFGRLLLRSRLQLGHSLMNEGRWFEAAREFEGTLSWMNAYEQELRIRYQDDYNHYGYSLRWDDIWLECHQYLSIVLRNSDPVRAEAVLQTALMSLTQIGKRKREASNLNVIYGNIERDLTKLKPFRMRTSLPELTKHLLLAQEKLEIAGDTMMIGAIYKEWANFYSRAAIQCHSSSVSAANSYLDKMQFAIEESLRLCRSPLLETNSTLDGIKLCLTHGIQFDSQQLQKVANHCITCGFGGQAEKILYQPQLRAALPSSLISVLQARFGSSIYRQYD